MADPASRYTILDSLPAAPGYDWITRSIQGPFVDTGVNIEFAQTGRLYLSKSTVEELAAAFGITGDKSTAALTAEAQSYFRGYAEAVKENGIGQLSHFVDRLSSIVAALGDVGSDDPAVVEVPRQIPAADTPSSGDDDHLPEENESGIFTTDGPLARQDDQSASDKGPDLLPSGPSDDHRL